MLAADGLGGQFFRVFTKSPTFLSGILLLSACGATAPGERNVTGTWRADSHALVGSCYVTLNLQLRQGGQSVSGNWYDDYCTGSAPDQFTVTGSNVRDSVNLLLHDEGQFVGRINAHGDSLSGTLSATTFGVAVVFVRQH